MKTEDYNDWTDNDLEQLSRIAPNAEKCGAPATSFIPRWGMYWSCELPKGHEGDHRRGGNCFAHGEYVGEKCPHWPNCIAGAPSERAGKIREEIAEILSNYMDVPACQPDKFNEMVQRLDRLLDAECKAAVARRDEEWELAKQIIYADAERQVKAEEERAFKEREELRSTHLVHQFDEAFKTTREHAREICKLLGLADSENWLYVRHEVPNYIALREADARIAEAHLAHGQKHSSYVCGFEEHCWYRERVRALTEARDRIAKETK